jgi:broad specificity phosphatase PhoE
MNRRTLFFLCALIGFIPCTARAQSVVFVVRHAERADAGMTSSSNDPDLSAAGQARAESLAAILKDARISAIYITEFNRTRQTAAPLAKTVGVEPIVMSSKDMPALIAKVKARSGNVLIVGHSNTVPEIIRALGGEAVTVGDSDFDNLFVVTAGSPPSVVRLHYR